VFHLRKNVWAGAPHLLRVALHHLQARADARREIASKSDWVIRGPRFRGIFETFIVLVPF
jgi:hypothetical protein